MFPADRVQRLTRSANSLMKRGTGSEQPRADCSGSADYQVLVLFLPQAADRARTVAVWGPQEKGSLPSHPTAAEDPRKSTVRTRGTGFEPTHVQSDKGSKQTGSVLFFQHAVCTSLEQYSRCERSHGGSDGWDCGVERLAAAGAARNEFGSFLDRRGLGAVASRN